MLSGTTFVLRVGFWKASINVKEEQKNIFVLFGKLYENWTDFTKFCSSDFRYSLYECLVTKFKTICNIINPKSDRPFFASGADCVVKKLTTIATCGKRRLNCAGAQKLSEVKSEYRWILMMMMVCWLDSMEFVCVFVCCAVVCRYVVCVVVCALWPLSWRSNAPKTASKKERKKDNKVRWLAKC